MTVNAAILVLVVAFLLPLRLLTLALRLFVSGRGASAGDLRRSFAALALTAALLAAIFALPPDRARECAAPASVADGGRDELRAEVEQLKLQLSRLDSQSLWDNSKVLDDKSDALEKDGRVMRALGLDIQSLFDAQENIKESLRNSYYDNIRAMENEVHILKDESRKMNSDIYNVHSLAKDTTERVEALHTDIKKVQAITDEWGKMNSNINRIWSFAKDTEKRVEDLYSDIKRVSSKQRERCRSGQTDDDGVDVMRHSYSPLQKSCGVISCHLYYPDVCEAYLCSPV